MPFSSKKKAIHINYPMIVRILGMLLLIEGLFMLIPTVTAVIYHESELTAFLISLGIILTVGLTTAFTVKPQNKSLGKRDGILLTSLVWCVFSFFGMLPLMIGSVPLSITDAFFETMSGFTTTGATVYGNVEELPYSINIWRCLTQWIGGLGIVLFTLAVLPMFNHAGGMQMFNAEMTGVTHEKLSPRINNTAKILWFIYGSLTLLLTLLLWLGSGSFFHSICHAFTTMSTGGFSTTSGSSIFFNTAYGKLILTVFMFLGGVNFALIYKVTMYGGLRTAFHDETLRTYCKVIAIGFAIFIIAAITTTHFDHWYNLIIDPLFQIVSTVTSTGFTVHNYESWGSIVPGLMILAMFFGACAGSTSGGAKIDRMLYLVKNCNNELYRTVHPNAIRSVRINGTVIQRDTVNRVIVFLALYMLIVAVSAILLMAMGVPVGEAFFDTYSCITNNGLSLSFAGIENMEYVGLPDTCKWILSLVMLAGRLELFSVLVLFSYAFWHK